MSIPAPFASGRPSAGLSPDNKLQTELENRINSSKNKDVIRKAGIGLVDLTQIAPDPSKGPFPLPFASLNTDKEVAVFSLSKIAAMFAAFHLRDRVAIVAPTIGSNAKDVNDLMKQIEVAWKPQVSKKSP